MPPLPVPPGVDPFNPTQERPPRDVDPPENNLFNNPNSQFVVTDNRSGQIGEELGSGGLLGRWLALNDEQARNAVDAYRDNGSGVSGVAQAYTTPPQESPAVSEKPVRILSRRLVR